MSMIEKMNQQIEEIEFLVDLERQGAKALRPILLPSTPPQQQPPLLLTAEMAEDMLLQLQNLRTLPQEIAQETAGAILEKTGTLSHRLKLAVNHSLFAENAMQFLRQATDNLSLSAEDMRTAALEMATAAKKTRAEAQRYQIEAEKTLRQMAKGMGAERAAWRATLTKIPTVRRYFGMCLLAMLLSSAISAGIFGLAWQQNRPDPILSKKAETFDRIWLRATDLEKRQIEKIIVRQLQSQQTPTPPAKKR